MTTLLDRLRAMAELYETSVENLLRNPPPGMGVARTSLADIHRGYAVNIREALALLSTQGAQMTDTADLREQVAREITDCARRVLRQTDLHAETRNAAAEAIGNAAMGRILALLPTPTVGEGWQELAELSAKATDGPWNVAPPGFFGDSGIIETQGDHGDTGIGIGQFYASNPSGRTVDAAFVVAAVNYVRSALSASPREGGSS